MFLRSLLVSSLGAVGEADNVLPGSNCSSFFDRPGKIEFLELIAAQVLDFRRRLAVADEPAARSGISRPRQRSYAASTSRTPAMIRARSGKTWFSRTGL